ncbi:MAG: hypothetical protein ACXQS1_02110 [Methermicoccaceae archaeon]
MDGYPKTVQAAIMEAKDDAEMVDVIGTIKEVERRYKPYVSMGISEIEFEPKVPLAGEERAAEVGNVCSRSYNTPRLMRLLQDHGLTVLDLLDMGIITIKWNWTPLKGLLKRKDIEYTIVDKEVSEMGEADGDIGENWNQTRPKWS